MRVMSRSEKSRVAACRTTAPVTEPQAAVAVAMVGMSTLEKASIWSIASRPSPSMDAVSDTATRVMTVTPMRSAVRVMALWPDWNRVLPTPQNNTTSSINPALRKALCSTASTCSDAWDASTPNPFCRLVPSFTENVPSAASSKALVPICSHSCPSKSTAWVGRTQLVSARVRAASSIIGFHLTVTATPRSRSAPPG